MAPPEWEGVPDAEVARLRNAVKRRLREYGLTAADLTDGGLTDRAGDAMRCIVDWKKRGGAPPIKATVQPGGVQNQARFVRVACEHKSATVRDANDYARGETAEWLREHAVDS